jgi:hypothetical protein
MSHNLVRIRELIGWGSDSYKYRTGVLEQLRVLQAAGAVAQRSSFELSDVLLGTETEKLRKTFDTYAERPDLLAEMSGLSWSLGVVDLRSLIAFQRRLAFTPDVVQHPVPAARDWPALFALSFGPSKPIEYEAVHDRSAQAVTLRSSNPNLHLRVTNDPEYPLSVHAGGPFFEVASFRNRWFLRDGYHRAYALLKAQVFEVPAVIVQARTIEELGADQAWFFPEQVLFSNAPPRVVDFLNEDLVIEYKRPPLIKTLRIMMEENFNPAFTGESQ